MKLVWAKAQLQQFKMQLMLEKVYENYECVVN